jgi:hypothetical protein
MKPTTRSLLLGWIIGILAASQVHAADHGDPILIVDKGAGAILLIQPFATVQEVLWSGSPLVSPTDAIVEADGNVLIIDPGAGMIFHMEKVGGVQPQPFITSTGSTCWIQRVGSQEILGSGPDGLTLFNTASGTATPLSTALDDAMDLDTLPDGNILVADPGLNSLVSVDPTTWAGRTFSPDSPNRAIAVSGDGQIAAVGPSGVFLVDDGGGELVLLSSGGALTEPTAVAFGGHGDIYVADPAVSAGFAPGDPVIIKIHPVSGAQIVVATGGFMREPSAILVLNDSPQNVPAIRALGQVAIAMLLIGVALRWRRSLSAGGL